LQIQKRKNEKTRVALYVWRDFVFNFPNMNFLVQELLVKQMAFYIYSWENQYSNKKKKWVHRIWRKFEKGTEKFETA
jgi:hypothetical protein